MDFEEVRRIAITALFSDDLFFEKLVLKGGNALRLIYRLGSRSSLDIDLSIEDDFNDLEEVGQRLRDALGRRFEQFVSTFLILPSSGGLQRKLPVIAGAGTNSNSS